MIATQTGSLVQAQEIIRPLQEFILFPELPAELRDKIWKFAAPEREGTETHVVIRKIKFKIAFSCEMKALGMVRACREARQVIVERLPIRLRSRDLDQEIRLVLHDVLSVRNIKSFLADPHRAESYELEIPTAIFQIPALVFFSDIDGATDLQGFWSIFFGGYNSSPLHISVLKALRTLVFSPEDRRQSTHGDADCFSDYTTNFDSSLLTPDQSGLFAHAKTSESILKHGMNIAKQASCTWPTDMKIPEIKIMAKGWPEKKIEPVEEIEKS